MQTYSEKLLLQFREELPLRERMVQKPFGAFFNVADSTEIPDYWKVHLYNNYQLSLLQKLINKFQRIFGGSDLEKEDALVIEGPKQVGQGSLEDAGREVNFNDFLEEPDAGSRLKEIAKNYFLYVQAAVSRTDTPIVMFITGDEESVSEKCFQKIKAQLERVMQLPKSAKKGAIKKDNKTLHFYIRS